MNDLDHITIKSQYLKLGCLGGKSVADLIRSARTCGSTGEKHLPAFSQANHISMDSASNW